MVYKMYVWDDILYDYSSGLVCVYASSMREAVEAIVKKAFIKEDIVFMSALEEIFRILFEELIELNGLSVEEIIEILYKSGMRKKPKVVSGRLYSIAIRGSS